MRTLALMALLVVPTAAAAQTSSQTGLWIDAHPGLGLGGQPFVPTFGARGSVGLWWGNYDHGFLLGRSWGVGAAFRTDVGADTLRLAPSLEVRRTVDLLVLGLRGRALVGPEIVDGQVGVGARLGGSVKVRPSPYVGPTLDLEAGAAWVDGRISPRFGVSIGVEFAFAVSGRERRDRRRDDEDR